MKFFLFQTSLLTSEPTTIEEKRPWTSRLYCKLSAVKDHGNFVKLSSNVRRKWGVKDHGNYVKSPSNVRPAKMRLWVSRVEYCKLSCVKYHGNCVKSPSNLRRKRGHEPNLFYSDLKLTKIVKWTQKYRISMKLIQLLWRQLSSRLQIEKFIIGPKSKYQNKSCGSLCQ